MSTPRQLRATGDVRDLPDVVFGPADLMWWGTLGFVLIEGFTLVLCAAAYVYLQQNGSSWPPPNTRRPDLGVPTLALALMLGSIPVMMWLDRKAHARDLPAVKLGLLGATMINAIFVGMRMLELKTSLNVRWDANAYGSAVWLVFCCHGTLLLVELIEIAGIGAMFWLAPVEEKHFSDVSDATFYWYFMVVSWVPLYILSVLGPRWM